MKTNREIRAKKVRVIAADGKTQLGVMDTAAALQLAEKDELDLIEISPNANPPVCKLINYGKFRYRQAKKEKENKKAQHQVKVKEIKLKPNIDVHDFQTKVKKGRAFILNGNKIRVTCMFRGREMLHMDRGEGVVRDFCNELQDIAHSEAPLKRMGKSVTTVLAPALSKKKK